LRQRTHARAHALVGWLSGRLDLSVRPCGRARGVAGVGVVYHMVLPIKFMADWGEIEQQRQKEMGRNNRRKNASRINYHYKVGDKILLKKPGKHLRKLEAPRTGPHTVTAIYTSGTVRIQKGEVNERVNIRRLFPYFENANHEGSECTIPGR
jgi:hypothetical protein